MKKFHALFVALLPIAALPVMPAQAALDCDNGFCVQSFYYTGTPQTFEVPDGIGAIRYEIYGASGARGGAGALAQGYLQNLPDQLIIQVGGAGGLGANRPGGYNGGGASGGSRNNEGAGGGASDIRLDTSLESRIVVAGGGGGGGDDDETGYDGGGGGGGSSYAHPDYVTNSSFESGLNWGHGRVMLYYQMVPSVTSFSGAQTNLTEMSFDLVMNQNIQNLGVDDFEFASGNCQVNRVAIDLNTANIRLRNCTGGEIGLTLKAGSVGEWELGPLTAQTAYALNDLTGPTLLMTQPNQLNSTSAVVIPITYSELVPTLGSFSLPDCLAELTQESLILSSCSEGVKSVSVLGSVASDPWGNVGPTSQSVSFEVDLTSPTFSHIPTFSGVTTFSYQLMLQFSETVEIALDAISVSSSMSCSQEVNAQTQVCGHGSVSWSVNLALITDLVGHPVGQGLVHFLLDNPAPEPDPIPQEPAPQPQAVTPAPVPAPVQPEPVAPPAEPQPTGPAIVVDPSPEPIPVTESASVSETGTESGDVTGSESVAVEPVSDSEEIELPVADPVGAREEFVPIEVSTVQEFAAQGSSLTPAESPQVMDTDVLEESLIEPEPEASELESEPEIQALVSGPQVDLEQDQSWPWLEIAIASLLLGLIAFGAYRTIGK